MSRGLSAAYIAALDSDAVMLFHLLEVALDAQSYYMTDAYKQVTWNGNDYIALGHLLSFDTVEETTKLQVNDCQIGLSGVDQTYVSVFLSQDYINQRVRIYQAVLDETHTLVVDPIKLFDGRMDKPVLADDPDSGTSVLNIKAVNQWSDFERTNGRRTNDGSQRILFPNDYGFEYASELQKEIIWGRYDSGRVPQEG